MKLINDALRTKLLEHLLRNDPSTQDHHQTAEALLVRTCGSGVITKGDPKGDIVTVLRGPFAGRYRSARHVPRNRDFYARFQYLPTRRMTIEERNVVPFSRLTRD